MVEIRDVSKIIGEMGQGRRIPKRNMWGYCLKYPTVVARMNEAQLRTALGQYLYDVGTTGSGKFLSNEDIKRRR